MASTEIPVLGPLITKIFGSRNERMVTRYTARVQAIGELEPQMRALTDEQLRAKTEEFRERIEGGAGVMSILNEVFAVARESMDRNVGMRNVFNPTHAERFPVDEMPAAAREAYERTKAAMEAAEPREPKGDLLGNEGPLPAWVWMDIPNEVYDAVREMFPNSRPPFRARPFDVQLIGAMVLYQGRIAEMKTGEGKTIVGPIASYLAAVEGLKVHVVTVNDYLVQRDRDWVFPFFRGVGMTVGAIHPMHMQNEDIKRRMYQCDVVYGTTAEFGFDYLRDNMKRTADQQVQRLREFAIVDEVDSILIDEARTPLIISGAAHEGEPRYELADQLARHLVRLQAEWTNADEKVDKCKKRIKGLEGDIRNARDKSEVPEMNRQLEEAKEILPKLEAERDRFTQYFEVERDRKSARLTHQGIAEAQKKANIGSFYVGENQDLHHLLEQSLRAHAVYELDVDYVIMPGQNPQTGRTEQEIVIVDVNTGRPMVGRQWSDGLHQAVQAKEQVPIRQETQTVATITIQNFFKMYKRLAGMTGTADTEAQEFYDIYKLDVVTIPTNVPVIRNDFDDLVYLSVKDKWDAIVEEIKNFHDMGRPVLVGTTSVEKSEFLAKMLGAKHGIKHEVLNAKQHEREAHIVENAGQLGAVMIATNMAGRGTDIKLARIKREELLEHWLRRGIAPRELTVEDSDEQVREKVYRKIAAKELGVKKREAEEMAFAELQTKLLRKWTLEHTWVADKKIESMSDDEMRQALDAQGRFGLHRIGWYKTVEELGGLHVIGTERHESRRIDNQLRGRSGRQGDHGSSRFFVSLEDDLMKMFAGETTLKILSRLGMKEGDAIEHPMLSKSIVRAQRKVEERNFQIRKNILEYDEVMEHQRQGFYGMRQRVLDGRDIRGLIFEFIEDASRDAVGRYLDKDYALECIAQYAMEKTRVSIPPERLRRREGEEILDAVRREALDEARHEVSVTMGEYYPEGGGVEDIDVVGLERWARDRFGLELTAEQIHGASPRELSNRLLEAAEDRIGKLDLSEARQYLVPNYGHKQLSAWLRKTMNLDVPVEKLLARENEDDIVELVLGQVREAYDKREVEYPVEFMMEWTMGLMRHNADMASANLSKWTKQRFGTEMADNALRTKMPQQIAEDMRKQMKAFVESGRLEEAVAEAQACATWDELTAHFREKYEMTVPHWVKRLKGKERDDQIRARVETILRSELVWFEQTVLLQVLDPVWKDHLYGMDQLRDSIGFRAFSQQDPRIEYKREGARLFGEMWEKTRDRVAEYVFRLRLLPQVSAPAPAPRQQSAVPVGAGASASKPAGKLQSFGGSSITGPGIDSPGGGPSAV
ncbi:MAG: preprotein translocase subunit SecA [Phycisphaerales bacterium]|nr:preprotein translocase subunit SecA [Phycisphaerales bacterium]